MDASEMTPQERAATWNERQKGRLPARIGVHVTALAAGTAEGEIAIQPHHLAPNGFLHAATVIGLADTLSGYGCRESLPEGANGFTTIEIKSNFLGTAREGTITARARMVHSGRTTQVWDAEVQGPDGRAIALFRCTQMVLYPKS
ncbi:MAG: PaaI family thioesterase [Dehalococcoidia bacterium]|nr:PaaI family thioesterase [Dehalococcoidia bacterium]